MNDVELFFKGGLRLDIDCNPEAEKAIARQLGRLAQRNRLPFSGRHIVVDTQRAASRAKGAGIVSGAVIARKLQKTLIASGVKPELAKNAKWREMW